MAYLVDPVGAPSTTANRDCISTIVLVGCGGTGGFLAEAVCRLLFGRPSSVYLVDPDRVEEHNVARQAFLCGISGRWQAQLWSVVGRHLVGSHQRCCWVGGCGRYGIRPRRSASSCTSRGA